jgi:hypothetical protein
MKVPQTEQEVIDFIGSNFNTMYTTNFHGDELPVDMIRYDLTVHDLLSAFAQFECNGEGELNG